MASQQKAAAAIKEGKDKDEIIPVEVKMKKDTFLLFKPF
nr:hypothetical protein [Bacillus sp. OK048]